MTFELAQMLKETYPPILNFERINIYGKNERISLNLLDFCFDGKSNFNDHTKIEALARKIFDVPFVYEKKGDIGPAIFFQPKINDSYHQNHTNHYINVYLPGKCPEITISTGNRGPSLLIDKQRQNYFQFVNQIFELFKNQ